MTGLTAHQQEVFVYLVAYSRDHDGRFPSLREMKAALGISSTHLVHQRLVALEERGYIRRIPGRPRAIEIVTPSVELKPDIHRLLSQYAKAEHIPLDLAANELLRKCLDRAA